MRLQDIGVQHCSTYVDTTNYGAVQARLTDTSLKTADNNAECRSATRMVGSVALNNPLIVTDDVKAYELTWIIRDMGIESTDGAGNAPADWKGGPFIPNFTLLK